MTNDSRLIAATFFDMSQFCRDVALLLRTSDELFKRVEWQQAQAYNTSLYSGSSSIDWPDYWLPFRFFRSYRNPAWDRMLAYVAVVIDLPRGRELEEGIALLTAGGLQHDSLERAQKTPSGESTNVFLWHTLRADRVDDGNPRWHAAPFAWQENRLWKGWADSSAGINAAVTLGLPLHEVVSNAQLESRIVAPLLKAISDGSRSSSDVV